MLRDDHHVGAAVRLLRVDLERGIDGDKEESLDVIVFARTGPSLVEESSVALTKSDKDRPVTVCDKPSAKAPGKVVKAQYCDAQETGLPNSDPPERLCIVVVLGSTRSKYQSVSVAKDPASRHVS